MRSKIWRSMALTAVLAVLLFAILSMALLYSFFTSRTERELDHEANMVAAAMEGGAELSALSATHPDGRMTHIAPTAACSLTATPRPARWRTIWSARRYSRR